MPRDPESPTTTPKPGRSMVGPIKVTADLKNSLDARRQELKLNWQQLGREALTRWLDGGVVASPSTQVPRYYVWWMTENVRKQTNFRLPYDAPEYLEEGLESIRQLSSRPRGRIWNTCGDDVDLPVLEKLTGINPRARWLWDEAPAGVLVREQDLRHLARIPGVITSIVMVKHRDRLVAEVGP